MPPDGGVLAAGQRVDVRVEATVGRGRAAARPDRPHQRQGRHRPQHPGGWVPAASAAPAAPGPTARSRPRTGPAWRAAEHDELPAARLQRRGVPAGRAAVIEARTADGARATVRLTVAGWQTRAPAASARNVILLLGDGMGIAHRTAARIVSRGLHNGKANGRLAMDTLDVTGMVMTAVAQLGHHRFVSRAWPPTRPARRTATTRQASSPTTPPTPSTIRASSTSASCWRARAAAASTSAS